ncbi:MAG: site-2 protease family protein [Lunatimonas sp.]|uniref:site-2 protease family protein n=1 Tax=Lunatimonas sp. TaxID=2060141 RepID=UPI00263B64D8|nr:site-2 protease family protein [Lunatimonas sp.]MCC5935643.1 site-2 protease family protein [Lunatimonas sp.]
MKFSLYLGKYKGIKVFIHWTFSILLLWIIIANARSGMAIDDSVWSVVFILAIFFCVLLHEFGHALTAQKYQIQTKDIILLPIGGLARLEKIPEDPRQELYVALAGPLVNVVIFFVLSIVVYINGTQIDRLEDVHLDGGTILLYLASANLLLAVFNMLPAFPMDGGRVLRALLSIRMDRVRATQIAGSIGQMLAIGFVFFGLFYNPIMVFIGIFIFLGAQAEVNHTTQTSFLKGFHVSDVVMGNFPIVAYDAPLKKAIEKLLDGQSTHFVVVKDDMAIGTLSREDIIKGLQSHGDQTLITEVANKNPLKLELHLPLEEAVKKMASENTKVALVFEEHHFMGMLDQENISEFIMVKNALVK